MTATRIIDANENRAREALRVMEEAARFLLDDVDLTEAIKQMRHDLVQALQPVRGSTAHRDTPGDVGTAITAPTEMRRDTVADVLAAAGKRMGEALRSIEEYTKVLPGGVDIASQAKALRYRGYEVERQLLLRMGSRRPAQWRLCVLLSEALCPGRRWLAVADAALQAGCDCLQLREKQLDDRTLLDRARTLATMCRTHGASLVVNDRPDIALLAGADAVHVGQGDLPCTEIRQVVGRQLQVGVSTSCVAEAEAALGQGADYCGLGPMFPTTTKRKDVIVGPAYAEKFLGAFPEIPHLAIGGIDADNVSHLTRVGVQGIAVSLAVCAADDPGQAVRDLLMALEMGEAASAS